MKKIVVLVCLTLVAQNSPMNAPAVLAARCALLTLGTAPVTLPGAYYHLKTERAKRECAQNNSKFDASQDKYRHFVQGAFYGAVPPINGLAVIVGGVAFGAVTCESLRVWTSGGPTPISQLSSDPNFPFWRTTATGFAAGLSLWATVPAAWENAIMNEAALIKLLRRGR